MYQEGQTTEFLTKMPATTTFLKHFLFENTDFCVDIFYCTLNL